MIEGWQFVVTVIAALGCGLIAGVFFAFSAFVMKALAKLPAQQGIAAMQSINVEAVTTAFMAALFGTAAICLVLTVTAVFTWSDPYAPYLLAGGLVYLIGTIMLTIGYHVPRNDALDRVDPDAAGAADHWARYVKEWTTMNHVRTVAPLAAAALFVVALRIS